jgi:hypothetical protein
MIQRLLVPLAVRSFLLAIAVAGLSSVLLAPVQLLRGEHTTSATLRGVSAGVSWTGSAVSGNAAFDQAGCEHSQTCDLFALKVDIADRYRALHPQFAVSIRLSWDDPQNDFDLYASKDGRIVSDSSQCQTNFEEIRLNHPANGNYNIYVQTVSAALATTYDGRVRILPVLPDTNPDIVADRMRARHPWNRNC